MYICSPQKRAISSVGLEHLPYKQGVVGSNPTSPTSQGLLRKAFFYASYPSIPVGQNLHGDCSELFKNRTGLGEALSLFRQV